MSRPFFLKPRRAEAFLFAAMLLLAGCRSNSDLHVSGKIPVATPDLNADLAQAAIAGRPAIILIVESGQSRADDRARALFDTMTSQGQLKSALPILLDLGVSRNRATAARFHAANTPVLLGISPKGLIVTRDEKQITKELILNRIADVTQRGPELDTKYSTLEEAAHKEGNKAAAELELADFLLANSNAREAIPHFESVARDPGAPTTLRIHAWVDLARAHFWVAEAEKGRHEAENLIVVLSPVSSEALAGGNFALGLQDVSAKRWKLARQELEAAIAAAPASDYARQAAATLATFPKETK